ncbi:MAG: Vitamin K epoxide reductase [Parcubacteria group bacterium GW2011_GWF2_42_7]|nr:MAG: Vitamin K epoxide reductase [Parcubacteria group bacterium GW2011_GWF2_42_7]
MRNSKISSARPLLNQKRIKAVVLILAAVSFFGFLDAGYLAVKHYTQTPIVCSIFEGCDKVTSSPYAVVFDVPVALLGLIFYLAIFFSSLKIVGAPRFDSEARRATSDTKAASLYFIYLQLFVIKAVCFYCVLSAASSAVLFILSISLKLKVSELRPPTPPTN